MKTTKRLLSCLLVLAMLFALAIPAFAADNVTITVKSTKAGAKYTLYKLFEADSVDVEAKEATYVPGNITKDDLEGSPFTIVAGHVVLAKDEKGNNLTVDRNAQWFLDAAKEGGVASMVEQPKDGGKDLTWNVQPGYYFLVKETEVDGKKVQQVVNIATAGPVTMYDKNNTTDVPGSNPDPDHGYKWVVEGTEKKDVVMAAVGETLKFVVEFDTVNYVAQKDEKGNVKTDNNGDVIMEAVTEYTITDIPEGLTVDFNAETTTVVVGDKTLSKADGEYTVIDDGHTIKISWDAGKYSDPSKITVTYEGTVTTTSENVENPTVTNDVELKYNGKAINTPDEEHPETEIYTGTVRVFKYDENKAALPGAVFALKNAEGENAAYYVKNADGTIGWVTPNDAKDNFTKVTSGNVQGEGDARYNVEFTGLDDGTYYVVEIQAPAGYNPTHEESSVTTEVKVTNGVASIEIGRAEVQNLRGTTLPSTGGIGTTMFYVVGGLLVAAAVVVLVSKKRMGAEQ